MILCFSITLVSVSSKSNSKSSPKKRSVKVVLRDVYIIYGKFTC